MKWKDMSPSLRESIRDQTLVFIKDSGNASAKKEALAYTPSRWVHVIKNVVQKEMKKKTPEEVLRLNFALPDSQDQAQAPQP